MATPFESYFNKTAEAYAEFRPDYPQRLYDILYDYCGFAGTPGLAIDLATGTGQASRDLSKVFEKVIGIDPSQEQIDHATGLPNVEFRVGTAEQTGLDDHCAELVGCAEALHWFDYPKFWPEVVRVLKPRGVFAAWGYQIPDVDDNPAACQVIRTFMESEDALGPYFTDRQRLVDTKYASVVPDDALFSDERRESFTVTRESTIDSYVGFVSSWSAYPKYREANPDKDDPLIKFRADLLSACHKTRGSEKVVLSWCYFLIMVRARG